ncbi:hypothetical protein GCM10017673_01790 [Streptosporangium violaceochromogenes]|nr:hypothetical protein GCM10017673_01790 [Streptosporangium violaceochromogenes]
MSVPPGAPRDRTTGGAAPGTFSPVRRRRRTGDGTLPARRAAVPHHGGESPPCARYFMLCGVMTEMIGVFE